MTPPYDLQSARPGFVARTVAPFRAIAEHRHMTEHPLDPLTADEIRAAAAILRRDHGVTERWRFASIELREPGKQALREGAPLAREATVICWNRDDGNVYKARVDLSGARA